MTTAKIPAPITTARSYRIPSAMVKQANTMAMAATQALDSQRLNPAVSNATWANRAIGNNLGLLRH